MHARRQGQAHRQFVTFSPVARDVVVAVSAQHPLPAVRGSRYLTRFLRITFCCFVRSLPLVCVGRLASGRVLTRTRLVGGCRSIVLLCRSLGLWQDRDHRRAHVVASRSSSGCRRCGRRSLHARLVFSTARVVGAACRSGDFTGMCSSCCRPPVWWPAGVSFSSVAL